MEEKNTIIILDSKEFNIHKYKYEKELEILAEKHSKHMFGDKSLR